MSKSPDKARVPQPAEMDPSFDSVEGHQENPRDPAVIPGSGLPAGLKGLPVLAMESGASTEDEERREREKARDLVLVARVQAGDETAFAEILDLYQGRVLRIVRRIWQRERETAEDLTQEVFLRVFRGIGRLEGISAFSTWVHRITVNVCITEIRSRKALKRDRPTLSLDAPLAGRDEDDSLRMEPEAPNFDPGAELETRELFQACRNAIETLPSMWRMILQLRDLEEKSYEEISEILDLPIGTVRSRLHRARARVRALLEGGGR